MRRAARRWAPLPALALWTAVAAAAPPPTSAPKAKDQTAEGPKADAPVFRPAERAVSTWRTEATSSLNLTKSQSDALEGKTPPVARCVKLNNYWCIKKAGWNGEIAADPDGHVAFASAVEGAAVAALLLKRYYVDFHRRTAIAIISRWAPAQCGGTGMAGGGRSGGVRRLAPKGIAGTLRARWLATHNRGFATARPGAEAKVRRSVIADHLERPMATPTIAVGLGESDKPVKPMTLDALLSASPPSHPTSGGVSGRKGSLTNGGILAGGADGIGGAGCSADSSRIAAYAASAAAGIEAGPGGDLGLFAADGTPTANLATMMANMARVEIGMAGAKPALIGAGIAQAFKPGRN